MSRLSPLLAPTALIALTLVASSAQAQEPTPEPVPTTPAEPSPQPPADPAAGRARAQASVDQARKLIKLQRYDEATALLEAAFLVLDDPELLRMLGDAAALKGDSERAIRYWDSYIADPGVGDSSREPVRNRRAELLAQRGPSGAGPGGGEGDGEDDGEDFTDTHGITGWTAQGTNGAAGHLYLAAAGRLVHNQGPDYETPRGGPGEGAESLARGSYVHGGYGLALGLGMWLTDDLAVGLQLANDWMNWEGRAPTESFATTIVSGLRPAATLHGRYTLGWGVSLGAEAGADLMILTQSADPDCPDANPCAAPSFDSGLQGWRLLFGPTLGYRSAVADDLAIAVDATWAWVPLFVGSTDFANDVPAYTDASWLATFSVGLHWNL